MTELELFGFPQLSNAEAQQIDSLLQTLTVVPLDSQIARVAGQVRATYNVGTADAAIAATALVTGSTLLTRNIRDFRKVPRLKFEEV